MRDINAGQVSSLAADLSMELKRLSYLEQEIQQIQGEIQRDAERAKWFYELQALKLHNFYTGCERIFSLIASELNGGLPSGFDWHKRLLQRMSMEYGDRPPVLSAQTAKQLEEFLGFRHVVRNVYGFELDMERVQRLLERYGDTWTKFEADLQWFIQWLVALSAQLDQ
jgi:hypothetical protein